MFIINKKKKLINLRKGYLSQKRTAKISEEKILNIIIIIWH